MRALADVAGVGLVTPYNVFGSKGGVLVALFDDALDQVEARVANVRSRDPLARALAVGQAAAEIYTSNPGYYRPLLKALLGSGESIHRPFRRSVALYESVLEQAVADRTLIPGIAIDLVARQLVVICTGVLELWMHEEIADDVCSSQIVYSSLLCLRAVVDEPHAKRLLVRMRTLQKRMAGKPVVSFQSRALTL